MTQVGFADLVVLVVLVVEVVDLVVLAGDFGVLGGVFFGGFLAGVFGVFFTGDLLTDFSGAFA